MQGETAEIPAKRFARLKRALRASFGLLVDEALPQLCPSCREPVDGAGLCPACWSKLSFIAPPYCERLGIPFPFDGGPGLFSMVAIARPAHVSPRPLRCALRRHRAQTGPCLEVWRPARPCADHGALDGACRPRAHRR